MARLSYHRFPTTLSARRNPNGELLLEILGETLAIAADAPEAIVLETVRRWQPVARLLPVMKANETHIVRLDIRADGEAAEIDWERLFADEVAWQRPVVVRTSAVVPRVLQFDFL